MRRTAWVVIVGLAVGCFHSDPPSVTSEPPAQEPDETLVVYSLEPLSEEKPGQERYRGYLVLGSTAVTDAKHQQEIVSAVDEGIRDGWHGSEIQKGCKFMPRHGLHHVLKDGTITDWLICFECGQVKAEVNGKPREWEWQHRTFTTTTTMPDITHGPQKLLNDTLRNAGVKLADGAEKGE